MKIKIIQYFIGDDEKYLKLANLSEKITSMYCKIHHYDFKFDYIENDNNKFKTKDMMTGYKIHFINDHLQLNDCDYLVFLDGY